MKHSRASGRTSPDGPLLRLGLLLGGTFLAVVISEVFVRFFLPLPPGFSWTRSDGLALHAPGMRAFYTRTEFRTEVRTNRQGLRGREISPIKPPGTLRVLVLGDSYAEGLQVRWEDLLSSRLERALNQQPGPRVEVINAGVSGYGTADELIFLEKLGWQLQPDWVLLAFCVRNDVRDNLDRPLYDFSTNPPRRVEIHPPTRMELVSLRVKEFLSRRSQLYQLLRDRLSKRHTLDALLRKWGVRRSPLNVTTGNSPGIYSDFTIWFRDPPPADLVRGLDYTKFLLRRMQEESRNHHAHLQVAWIPIREQVRDGSWKELERKRSLSSGTRFYPQEMLSNLSTALDLDSVDLLPFFRQASSRGPLYFQIDGHWTPEGHRIAAETLAPSLINWKLKVAQSGVKEQTGQARVDRAPISP